MENVGFRAIGVDKNPRIIEQLKEKRMPFIEAGCQDLLDKSKLGLATNLDMLKCCTNIIITVGTPLLQHIETDLSQIKEVIIGISKNLCKGQNIVLRSTLAPKTTEFVSLLIKKETGFENGKDYFLSFCPERIAEGKALKELNELPQIIGANDDESFLVAETIFSKLTKDIIRMSYREAELVKLFNNVSRYISFAVANQFALVAESYNVDASKIINASNYKYPRNKISMPGLTAGTCLRKDFGMINEASPYPDLLLSSWKINEYMPKFLVESLLKETPINGKAVGVLGYSFKRDTDDTRDSLVPKLIRYIEREVPSKIRIHDPYLPQVIDSLHENCDLDDVLQKSDVIFIATNHSQFDNINLSANNIKPGIWICDIWNVLGSTKLVFRLEEDAE